jgi:hypothetical protein
MTTESDERLFAQFKANPPGRAYFDCEVSGGPEILSSQRLRAVLAADERRRGLRRKAQSDGLAGRRPDIVKQRMQN